MKKGKPKAKPRRKPSRLTAEDVLFAVMRSRIAETEEENRRIRAERNQWGRA